MKSVSPAENFKEITPHDTNEIKNGSDGVVSTRGIMVTGAGIVACKNAEGDIVPIPCGAGIVYPIVTSVITTASTATGIIALW